MKNTLTFQFPNGELVFFNGHELELTEETVLESFNSLTGN